MNTTKWTKLKKTIQYKQRVQLNYALLIIKESTSEGTKEWHLESKKSINNEIGMDWGIPHTCRVSLHLCKLVE